MRLRTRLMNEIISGDCLEVMKTFPDNHFSGIVTDPPYGISFMGKGWDHEVPDRYYWEEALRICKPGSFLIAMGGSRTFHRLTCAIEDAGFEIRDCISWIYGQGFPKSHNHFGIEGYGTALKPSWEPCIMAMKPLDGTFKQNAEKWGQAGINIDGCRVGEEEISAHGGGININRKYGMGKGIPAIEAGSNPHKGRWPANIILDEEASAMLDEQTGILKSGSNCKRSQPHVSHALHPLGMLDRDEVSYGDRGGGSRFFYCAKASSRERNEGLEGFPDRKTHRIGAGIGEGKDPKAPAIDKNNHPTVKPLALMRYLITLIAPPKDALILDPFAGSGSTIVAAENLGIRAIGIEKSEEYAEIARARIANTSQKIQKLISQLDFL